MTISEITGLGRASTRLATGLATVLALTLGTMGAATAQEKFPDRPIRLVLPFAAGGGTDTFARVVAEALKDKHNIQVIVENKPGAGGAIGLKQLAQSKPDGYTIGMTVGSSMSLAPLLTKSPAFDPIKDFVPVTNLASVGILLVGGPALKQKTLKEFIEAGKKNPKSIKVGYATAFGRLMMAQIAADTGAEFILVPYPGTGAAMANLLGGEIETLIDQTATSIEQIRAGKMFPLAVSSKKRSPQLPDVPTVGELVPGFDLESWFGVFAPPGTPPDRVAFLNRVLNETLQDERVKQNLRQSDAEPVGSTPGELGAIIKKELDRNRVTVEKYNLGE